MVGSPCATKRAGSPAKSRGSVGKKSSSDCRRLSMITWDFKIAKVDQASRTRNQIVTGNENKGTVMNICISLFD